MSKKKEHAETTPATESAKVVDRSIAIADYVPAAGDTIHMVDRSYKVTETDGKCVNFTETMADGSKPFKESHSEELSHFLLRIATCTEIEKA